MATVSKKTYRIELVGCDDYTSFTMELTDEQSEFLKEVAVKSQEESSYGCMPTMKIHEEGESDGN